MNKTALDRRRHRGVVYHAEPEAVYWMDADGDVWEHTVTGKQKLSWRRSPPETEGGTP